MTDVTAVETAIADAHRREWARVLAATVRVARDLDLAEECVQEAYASAMQTWVRSGIPDNPAAWLTTTAKRRAIDAIRKDTALRSRLPLLVEPEEAIDEVIMNESVAHAEDPGGAIPDERLRLIFTCCHPALAREAQVALTLRLVCGVPVADIARAFLISEQTDWPQIVALYDKLLEIWPSPVVALNRAVPLAMVAGPEAALAEVEKLDRDGRLSGYQYLHAIKADLLGRLGRTGEAADAYRQAFALAANEAERAFLAEQIAEHT